MSRVDGGARASRVDGGARAARARPGARARARTPAATATSRARPDARARRARARDVSRCAARDVKFCIDRGGTFTDVYAEIPREGDAGEVAFVTLKLLSEDPANYASAPREGIRRVLETVHGREIKRDEKVPTERIEWIRMGTTVGTNALLERKGAATALVTTRGFGDLLAIGNQARPDIFDLAIERPGALYERVVEVDERVRVLGEGERARGASVVGSTGETVEILKPLDVESLRPRLRALLDDGITSISVVLLHSYTFDEHERAIGALAREMGFQHVALSSALVPMVRAVPRGHTGSVDAYLTPCIRTYIDSFLDGFDEGLRDVKVSFMQSDGGLTPADNFSGYQAILSGPAGGVVGFALTTSAALRDDGDDGRTPIIGFDMGGTSTDVSRYDPRGGYEQVTETTTAGVTVQAPQLDITTVAAGGGSALTFRSGTFYVGPESVGSQPGPVCYRKGGALAVTDANLVLGRILPEYFPKIFGPNEDEALDYESSYKAFEEVTARINAETGESLSAEEVAMGFLRVANEAMCRPIREITESKGYEISSHVLAAFGGAGPQHACAIARDLGMSTVFVHRFCGILSAYGMGLADVVAESQAACAAKYEDAQGLKRAMDDMIALKEKVISQLISDGQFEASAVRCECFLNLRYDGSDTAMMVPEPDDGDYAKAFRERFVREYGFDLKGRALLIDDVRVRGVANNSLLTRLPIACCKPGEKPIANTKTRVYFENLGWCETPVFQFESLLGGMSIEGPAIIMNGTSTCVIEPICVGHVTTYGDLKITVPNVKEQNETVEADYSRADAILISIFSNRFMGIAERMGRTLQRTSVSTNIKERLDFSCAIFGPDGGLVANAPHVPVHLGAMSSTVSWQLEHWGFDGLHEGDVLVTNHPRAGGSHLPDITVVTPVFRDGRIVFFVASRGHHADVGGATPGSMPPFSKTIADEGAAIKTFKLVDRGVYQEEGIIKLLTKPDTGSRGTRKLADNLSDLSAQVAANQRGISLLNELIDECGLGQVQAYMNHVQDNAELAVRDMLKTAAQNVIDNATRLGAQVNGDKVTLRALDKMDDGSEVCLTLTLDAAHGTADFDFSGTSPEVSGNWNAPPAVTNAAVIYSIRCLVKQEIPLNQGCLKPVTISVPNGCFLSPSEDAAVVGGNVLTSQRVTDVCLAAFGACANAQGCMNNLTFGDDNFGYYETIGGGAGAGPDFNGASAVQCHMTNTRITDPEILERRYPVILREFSIRQGSGGDGNTKGGDGIVRELEFLKDVTVSVLSERRIFAPKGLAGGNDGARGVNSLRRVNGEVVDLGGKNSVQVSAGDVLRIETPGGGGYGTKMS
jgi:5-oxoprolinase (ATP-hydrolysing)